MNSSWRIAQSAFVVAVLGLSASARMTSACTCTEWPSFRQAYVESEAIFRGTVTGIRSADPTYYDQMWVTFQVNDWWKKELPTTIEILTGANEGICGFTFHVNSEYLVYALPWEGQLSTHLCWRTHLLLPDDPDLELLDTVPTTSNTWGLVKSLYR